MIIQEERFLESTYRTLDKLKRKMGIFVAIATGRAQYMAMDAAKEAILIV